jgi:type I restriction enzyme S subunit
MNANWSSVNLGEIAQDLTAARTFTLTLDEEVVDPTISSANHRIGIAARSLGANVRVNKRIRILPGDLVFSRLHTQNGAFAFADREFQATGTFVPLAVDESRVDRQFLYWTLHVKVPSLSASDTVGRETYKTQDILALKIPLPPLAEQQRIVARIEALAAKIAEACSLRRQAVEEANVSHSRAVSAILDDARWEIRQLAEVLVEAPRNGLSPKAEVATGGRPMLRINAVSSSPTRFVDLSAFKSVEVSVEEAEPFVLRDGDVFIVRYNGDINRVAKAAIFKGRTDAIFPDKLMRLRPQSELMIPDFLVYALSCRRVREQIEEIGKTTAGQIGVSGADAKAFVVPVPPVSEQHRIVEYLDGLQAKVDALKRLQSESVAELDAMLPAILYRAFHGELVVTET